MGRKTNQSTGVKGGLKKIIITIFSVIIVAIASILGIGGDASEEPASNTPDTIVSEDAYEEVVDNDISETISYEEEEPVSEEISEENSDDSEQIVEVVSEEVIEEEEPEAISEEVAEPEVTVAEITFRNDYLLDQHYDKHGIEMGFESAEAYELAAYKVIIHPDTLHKIEAEDGDDVYYLEATNEFVVVSQDGYIRTYFNPSAGIDYYNRQ